MKTFGTFLSGTAGFLLLAVGVVTAMLAIEVFFSSGPLVEALGENRALQAIALSLAIGGFSAGVSGVNARSVWAFIVSAMLLVEAIGLFFFLRQLTTALEDMPAIIRIALMAIGLLCAAMEDTLLGFSILGKVFPQKPKPLPSA